MKIHKQNFNLIFLSFLLYTAFVFGGFGSSIFINQSHIGQKLAGVLKNEDINRNNLVWIFFKDKGVNSDNELSNPGNFLTDKSIQRRLKRVKKANIFDERDLPLSENYIQKISELGLVIKNKSKWLNAVSCYADKTQIENISDKDFIDKIELVEKYNWKNDFTNNFSDHLNNLKVQSDNPVSINYGPSLNQSTIINVPAVHDMGYTGQNILIASFDAGFDNLQHNCFNKMRSKGLRTYDFVNGDTIVANAPDHLGAGFHGTLTLSLIAGYDPGFLVSPAFESKYILAKTENTQSETTLEEDNWVAAAEWADSLGADIITSSLGYLNFDPPDTSLTWESMDGNTALITRAADIAVSKGIIVVISSGNDGFNAAHNTLNAPADGDSVITVGAVNSNGLRADYSSVGPTFDGRIKPDVMALGTFNYTARPGPGNTGYTSSSFGTSLACPMVAGVCALILSANQDLSPIQVRDILRSTADSSSAPNGLRGWGIINALDAVNIALGSKVNLASDYILFQNFPNPFNPSTTFRFALRKDAQISLFIYDIRGRITTKILDNVHYSKGNSTLKFNFNNLGLSSGVYFYSLFANNELVDSRKMILLY